MTNDELTIRAWLRRFMDGTTTLDEERRIGAWFKAHPQAGGDLETYRRMFDWFAEGLPLGEDGEPASRPKPRPRRRLWAAAAALAIAAALSGTLLLHKEQAEEPLDKVAWTPTAPPPKGAPTAPGAERGAPPTRPGRQGGSAPAGRRSHRHHPAASPPAALPTVSDSAVWAAERMVDAEMERMEAARREAYLQMARGYDAIDDLLLIASLPAYDEKQARSKP